MQTLPDLVRAYLVKNNFEWGSEIDFSPVPKTAGGDVAISVFRICKSQKIPLKSVLDALENALAGANFLEKTERADPYLNLFFRNEVFFEAVFRTPPRIQSQKNQKILVEFSGPNTNKPLHLGHMRNHALGISVCRILQAAGAEVCPVNIINDRGVHICKSMLAYSLFGAEQTPESAGKKSDHFVGDFYVKFETESQKNPALLDQIQQMLQKWEDSDPETLALWEKMNNWALAGHQQTYQRQAVSFLHVYRESEHFRHGREIAEKALSDGVFRKNKDGAIVFDFEKKGKVREKVVLRADGTSIYLTNDLAVSTAKFADFAPDQMVWVVAEEQNEYFEILFSVLEKLKILDRSHLQHLSYRLVNLPDGRMKSRSGNVVDADNLMDELHDAAAEKVRAQHPDFSDLEVSEIAEKIQDASWKFYLLRTGADKSITFDAAKSIDFAGATGPYLQYGGVRIGSILQKAGVGDWREFLEKSEQNFKLLGQSEKNLGAKILQWPATLSRAAAEKNPTFIATYLTELGQNWASFYAQTPILNAENETEKNARIALAAKVLQILETGLWTLGIQMPEKM